MQQLFYRTYVYDAPSQLQCSFTRTAEGLSSLSNRYEHNLNNVLNDPPTMRTQHFIVNIMPQCTSTAKNTKASTQISQDW